MAFDPATAALILQSIRLGAEFVNDASRMLQRMHAENRDLTDDELRLMAARRREADDAYDAFLRSKGIEPGTGGRIT